MRFFKINFFLFILALALYNTGCTQGAEPEAIASPELNSDSDESYFFVFLNFNPDKEDLPEEELMDLQNRHLANIDSLYKMGDIVAAGPFYSSGGIFIISASSEEEAWDILMTDPAVSANRYKLEVFPFDIIQGGICELDIDTNYTMGTYWFLRHDYFDGMSVEKKIQADAQYLVYRKAAEEHGEVFLIGEFKGTGKLMMMKGAPEDVETDELPLPLSTSSMLSSFYQ